jgi:hypothetical protein
MLNTLVGRSPRWRGFGLVAVLLLASLMPACSDSNPNAPNVPRSSIFVSVEPNPVIGVQNALTGSVSAAYVVQIQELAGLGGTIQFLSSTVFDPETGIQASNNYFDSAALQVFEGTNRLEPQGTMEVTQSAGYTLPDFRVDAHLTINVQLLDDNGNLINYSTLVEIVPAPVEAE